MEGALTPAVTGAALGWLAAVLGAMAAAPAPGVVVSAVRPATGQPPVIFTVPDGAGVALTYRHSVWGVTVVERFEVTSAGLRLVRVEAPTPELDSYYHIPGARLVRQGRVYRLEVPPFNAVPELRVRVTVVGQRTLAAGGRCLPLERVGSEVVIRRARVPLWRAWRAALYRWLPGPLEPCASVP